MPPRKILYTIPNFDTAGSGKALFKIAERLDPTAFEPHLCCTHDRGDFFRTVKASGIPIHIVKYTTPMSDRWRGVRECWRISRFFRQFDLIHSFHYSDDYSEPLAARMAGVNWIYTKKNMSWGTNAWRLRTRLAHGIVAQNTDMMRLFFAWNPKATLIPRGVDTTEFAPRPPATHLYDEFALPPDADVILTVANLVPVKGIECLIDAFTAIADSRPAARLFIVGDDRSEYAAQLKVRAASGPATSRIVFTGRRSDVRDFQSIARAFVLPTLNEGRQEGSPVSLLEAMACETLVLASDVAGIRDQLAELPEQLFEPGDVADLTRKLNWTFGLSCGQLKHRGQEQGRIVQTRYTIEREVQVHDTTYRSVLHPDGS